MSEDNSISACHDDEFSWIRCDGKGSFLNSPKLKDWSEREIEKGSTCVVVDLEVCKGMDSTFMGTMAGLAMRLMKIPGGKLQVADPGERNRKSLEDLGLDVLMEIAPKAAPWKGRENEIRKRLQVCESVREKIEQAPHVLEAHQKLCEADENNMRKFGTVLDFLEAEVKAKESAKK